MYIVAHHVGSGYLGMNGREVRPTRYEAVIGNPGSQRPRQTPQEQFSIYQRDHGERITHDMTMSAFKAVESFPRFLLPRLSWNAANLATATQFARPLVAIPNNRSRSSKPRARAHQPATNFALCHGRVSAAVKSSSGLSRNLAARRAFHATPARQRDHHFDTLKFVQRLKEEGFTEEQAAAMMKVLNDVIEERYVR